MRLKTDSYVLEANIHFPTDLNLLWDSLRKCLDMIGKLHKITAIKGWCKIKNISRSLKSHFRATSHQVFKGKDEHKKKQYVKQYLHQAGMLETKAAELIKHPPVAVDSQELVTAMIEVLTKYKNYVTKFTGQIVRRLLKEKLLRQMKRYFRFLKSIPNACPTAPFRRG